jgi:hypothetical protein
MPEPASRGFMLSPGNCGIGHPPSWSDNALVAAILHVFRGKPCVRNTFERIEFRAG